MALYSWSNFNETGPALNEKELLSMKKNFTQKRRILFYVVRAIEDMYVGPECIYKSAMGLF